MKTLADHQLIYDKDCPLCRFYSGAFVESKMLDKNGRQNYRDLSAETKGIIDLDRARNEIALVNHSRNEVYYGLNSLLIIIGHSFPLLEKTGRLPFIYWFFQKIYSIVSYNRKQIIPSKNDALENACVPDFNLKYRLVYGVSMLILSSFLFSFNLSKLGFPTGFSEVLIIFLGLIIWQILFLNIKTLQYITDYLGNLLTILFAGTLLLLLLNVFSSAPVNLIIVVLFFIVEHLRRAAILKVSFFSTIAAVLYIGIICFSFQFK